MRSPKPRHRLVAELCRARFNSCQSHRERKQARRPPGRPSGAALCTPPARDAKMASHFDETATRGCLLRSVLHLSEAAGRIHFQADRKLICCRVFRPNCKSFPSGVREDDSEPTTKRSSIVQLGSLSTYGLGGLSSNQTTLVKNSTVQSNWPPML